MFSIPCYNSEEWIGKSLKMLLDQTYESWKAVVVLDKCNDDSEKIVHRYSVFDPRITYIVNEEKEYGLGSFIKAVKSINLKDEDVILHLDGDDWLTDNNVLSFIDNIYSTEDVWMTYGSCKRTHGTPTASINNRCASPMPANYDFRKGPWLFSVLKTFKYFLWKNLKDQDLRTLVTNRYYPRAWDNAIMRPIAEMCGRDHIRYVKELLYTYNDFHCNTCKAGPQIEYEKEIKNRDRYEQQTKENLIKGIIDD